MVVSKPSEDDIKLAVENLMSRGDLPDPDHYPKIVKTMIVHELFEIERKRYEQENQRAG